MEQYANIRTTLPDGRRSHYYTDLLPGLHVR